MLISPKVIVYEKVLTFRPKAATKLEFEIFLIENLTHVINLI